jgi:ATP-dependent DNA ligase
LGELGGDERRAVHGGRAQFRPRVVVDRHGLSVFDMLRCRQHAAAAVLCAFDLIEIDDEDLRPAPIEDRKSALADMLRKTRDGIA